MRYSQIFGKTVKETPREAGNISHRLLYRAGYIRESTAGRYYFLPLGWRVHEKIRKIIKQEMDKIGAQEMLAPVLHPKYLWEETNRDESVGYELMTVLDRRGSEFVLGGTAEEMFVDLVRKFILSYRDLPFNLYQFSTKFRDELRARGGLLRTREFMMKDAYSFHRNEKDFKKTYKQMAKVYSTIFSRLGLKTTMIESDNGYIGGEYAHEFVVESEAGESRYFVSEDGSYAAHEDVAKFQRDDKNTTEKEKPYKEVKAVRGKTMEDGVKLHSLPLWRQIKNVMYVDNRGRMVLAVVRGDLDVNEIKLARLIQAEQLRHVTQDEIRNIGSEPGFISPVEIDDSVLVVGDTSLRTIKNAYCGANKKNLDALNINIDRDYKPNIEGDIALAQDGYLVEGGKSKLIAKKGIEVGNIFQLGYYYTKKMKGSTFTDIDGREKPYYMGCYGIGIGRTMAAIVEKHHDRAGIVWPSQIAPYQCYLIGITGNKAEMREKTERIYEKLQNAGIEVLYDDRDTVSTGEKFADSDLIGIPVRLVVSSKTKNQVEVKYRDDTKTRLVSIEKLGRFIARKT